MLNFIRLLLAKKSNNPISCYHYQATRISSDQRNLPAGHSMWMISWLLGLRLERHHARYGILDSLLALNLGVSPTSQTMHSEPQS